MRVAYQPADDVRLPWSTAVWVLGAHLYALLVPLVLVPALLQHRDAVADRVDYPALLFVAVGLMMAGSAFEIAQNALDKWYLTPEAGSAGGTAFCDGMFYWLVTASQAAVVLACFGEMFWVRIVALLPVACFPLLYVRQLAPFAPLGLLGALAAVAVWLRFGDPVIFLQLLLVPLTLFFFNLLLATGAQFLHGLTTLAASSGVIFLAAAIHGGAGGQPRSWLEVAAVSALVLVVAAGAWPWLRRRPPTPRRF